MSKKDMNVPSTGTETKKSSNTVIIVVIAIVVLCLVLPLIIGAVIVFAVLGFIDNHFDEFDFKAFVDGIEYVEENGTPLTHNESTAVRNIISTIESKTLAERTISRRDCLYMQRIAETYSTGWIDEYTKTNVSFCDNAEIYGGVTYGSISDKDKESKYNGKSVYDLYLGADSLVCAHYSFSGFLNSHNGYGVDKSFCNDAEMVKIKIVDTGEQLEPKSVHIDVDDDDDDDDDDSDIKIRINA